MTIISDDFMREMLAKTKQYSIVILSHGPNWGKEGAEKIIWEHGRRNFVLRANGLLSIVCPIADGSNLSGVGVLNVSIEEARKIMDDDPAVKDGILAYEVHPCRSFPEDCLPK